MIYHRAPVTDIDRSMAKESGLTVDDYLSLERLMKTRNVEMSDADWALTARIAAVGTQEARDEALRAAASMPPNSVHRSEAIGLAKQFLAERHTHGRVAPILLLRKMGDPSWRNAASELEKDPDAQNREFGKTLLGMK